MSIVYLYTLTTDTTFQAGKTYYTRTGSGTTESPYVYDPATVTVGATVPANTYYEASTTPLNTVSWLPEDLTGAATSNYVQNERHSISTTTGNSRYVIIPAEGAFYDTSNLVITFHTATASTTLVRDNDYRLVGIDYGRTKVSTAQGGVYHFILITTNLNPDSNCYIEISYQAFGGYMSSTAYSLMLNAITELEAKLSGDGVITANNIASNATIQAITNELQALCNRMQYAPTVEYLAQTSAADTCVWNTVAISTESYDNTIDFTKHETLVGGITLTIFSKLMDMKVALNYDLGLPNSVITQPVHKGRINASVIYQNLPNYDSSVATSDATYFMNSEMMIPKFRVVTDSTSNVHPKVYIQMALVTNKNLTDGYKVTITDSTDLSLDDVANKYILTTDTTFVSGKVYYIKEGTDNYYRYTSATVTPGAEIPANTYYNLTSVTAVHNPSYASNFTLCSRGLNVEPPTPTGDTYNYSNAVLAVLHGVKIWEGNVNMKWVEDMSWTGTSVSKEWGVKDTLTPVKTTTGFPATAFVPGKSLEVYTVNYFICDIYDRWDRQLLTVKFPARIKNPYDQITYPPTTISGVGCYYPTDNANIYLDLTLDNNTKNLYIYSKSGKSSQVNERFDLRAIYIA